MDDFLYDQSSVYHCNPANKSDDSLSDSCYHHNYKHDNLSLDLLCQEDEQIDSVSEREGGSDKETDSASEREGGSDKETDSASEREGDVDEETKKFDSASRRDSGFDKETNSASESKDGSDVGGGAGRTVTLSLHWLSSHKKDHPSVEPELITQRFLLNLIFDAVDGNTCQIDMVTFLCFTEHKRGNHIYRAHPDYHKGGHGMTGPTLSLVPMTQGKRVTLTQPKFGFLLIFRSQ